jgi:oligosaccharide repeat unit polymerase
MSRAMSPKPNLSNIGILLFGSVFIASAAVAASMVKWTRQVTDIAIINTLFFAFLAAGAISVYKGVTSEDVFKPSTVFSAIYFLGFGIGSYYPIRRFLIVDLLTQTYGIYFISVRQWGFYIVGIAAFYVGYWLGGNNLHIGLHHSLSKRDQAPSLTLVDWNLGRLLTVILVSSVIGIGARVALYLLTGGIPILQSEINLARVETGHYGKLATLMLLTKSSAILSPYLFLHSKRKVVKSVALMVTILLLIILFADGDRTGLIEWGIITLLVYHYTYRRITTRSIPYMVVLGLVTLVYVGFIDYLRLYRLYGEVIMSSLAARGFGDAWFWVPSAFEQISMGTTGFSIMIDMVPDIYSYCWGWATLTPLRAPLPGELRTAGMWLKEKVGGEWAGYGYPVSILGGFYLDAGLVGILIGMLATGLITRLLYLQVRKERSPIWVYLFGLFYVSLIGAPRLDLTSAPARFFYIPLYLLAVHILVRRKVKLWRSDSMKAS